MKKLSLQTLFIILLGGSIISSCSSSGYKPAEYISTTGVTESGQETKIELDDGAAIIIPANAIDSEVSVKVERNPEKANNLPPLDENIVKVGDFYNFEIDGTINGAVDLVLPFNPDLVPENEAGVLVAAIPTENGWKYIPVIPDGNKVTLYTDQIGDPLIAWHFVPCTDRTDVSYDGHPDTACEDEQAKKLVCDPDIALDVVQNGEQFDVTGNVLPVAKNFFGSAVSEPAANIPVKIILNAGWRGAGQSYSVTTGDDGSFSFSIDQSKGLEEGWNWVFAKAECDPWWGKIVVESNGYAEFKYTPAIVEQPSSTQPTESPLATEPTASTEEPIPTGAILLPNFVGQDIDNAIDWLESNGFKYTWIDGSSTYDLGMVYNQTPAGGQYKVPHRTVMVLYRTVEKIDNPCAVLNLTAEECANTGRHTYQVSCSMTTVERIDTNTGTELCGCKDDDKSEYSVIISFPIENTLIFEGNKKTFTKTALNTYTSYETINGSNFNTKNTYNVIFSLQGYSYEIVEIPDNNFGKCIWHFENVIIK